MTVPLHLTRVLVGFDTAAGLRIRDSYDWHQRIWQCFPGRAQERRDFLTRLDRKEDHWQLLILGPVAPTRPEWCPADCFASREIKEDYFRHGKFAFQLRANPTKMVTPVAPDGRHVGHGRRVALKTPEEMAEWLKRKGAGRVLRKDGSVQDAGGFRVLDVTVTPMGRQFFRKRDGFGPHSSVDFRGTLEVTDAAAFRETLGRGIGSAKAFGFGLLAIAPLQ